MWLKIALAPHKQPIATVRIFADFQHRTVVDQTDSWCIRGRRVLEACEQGLRQAFDASDDGIQPDITVHIHQKIFQSIQAIRQMWLCSDVAVRRNAQILACCSVVYSLLKEMLTRQACPGVLVITTAGAFVILLWGKHLGGQGAKTVD